MPIWCKLSCRRQFYSLSQRTQTTRRSPPSVVCGRLRRLRGAGTARRASVLARAGAPAPRNSPITDNNDGTLVNNQEPILTLISRRNGTEFQCKAEGIHTHRSSLAPSRIPGKNIPPPVTAAERARREIANKHPREVCTCRCEVDTRAGKGGIVRQLVSSTELC